MRFLHISDLHIGKKVNEFSMIEDQKFFLKQILKIIDDKSVETVLIAGDIYDTSLPTIEAVKLLDEFLYELSTRNLSVFIISGNHDSAERIAFGSRIMEAKNIFFSPVFNGSIVPKTLKDDFGDINIYMLPFLKPIHIKRYFEDAEINNYTDAIRTVIESMNINKDKRNILLSHQYVTGSNRTESEEIVIGGLDNVDVSCYLDFDYVALGHIHRAQKLKQDNIRYSGTPIPYSFSEANDKKSVVVFDIMEKGSFDFQLIPIDAMIGMREIKGKYNDIVARDFYKDFQNDYLHITLTDEEDIPNALGRLRAIFKNIMKLDYDNLRTRASRDLIINEEVKNKDPLELLSELFEIQNNMQLSDEQRDFALSVFEKIGEVR